MKEKRRFAAARRAEVRKSRSEEERTRKIFDRLLTSSLHGVMTGPAKNVTPGSVTIDPFFHRGVI
jgi:hypothetical protein